MLTLGERLAPKPAPMAFNATLTDPVTGAEIAGVMSELSDAYVKFRADDGTLWAVPKELVRKVATPAGEVAR